MASRSALQRQPVHAHRPQFRFKCANTSPCTCFSHARELSKLGDALRRASEGDADERRAMLSEGHLGMLRQKWERDSVQTVFSTTSSTSNKDVSLRKGMRRVGDALEIDFSIFEDDEDEAVEPEERSSKMLPKEVKYFDTANIHVKAGDGGNGCCAFRREKFIAHGGPSGGNGGNGGSVWAVAEEGMNALTSFRNHVHWKAKSGTSGQGKDLHGANASDLYIPVPPGTIIRKKGAAEGEAPLAELLNHGTALVHVHLQLYPFIGMSSGFHFVLGRIQFLRAFDQSWCVT
jgi:hypothetical protein